MQPFRVRRYVFYGIRRPHDVSCIWRFFHVSIFIGIAASSLLGTIAFHYIFDIFSYNCMLYAKPVFFLDYKLVDQYSPLQIPNRPISKIPGNDTDLKPRHIVDFLETKIHEGFLPIPNMPDLFYDKMGIWVINATEFGRVWMSMRRTVFATITMCDYVMFVPLFSFVVAFIFGSLVIVCGRGGTGYAHTLIPHSWMIVYPILLFSFVLLIMHGLATNIAYKGLHSFCGKFSMWTGTKKCSIYMDFFTPQHMGTIQNFYLMYRIVIYSYAVIGALWCTQLILTLLRVAVGADFTLKMVTVRSKGTSKLDEETDKAIKKAIPGVTEVEVVLDENLLDEGEVTAV